MTPTDPNDRHLTHPYLSTPLRVPAAFYDPNTPETTWRAISRAMTRTVLKELQRRNPQAHYICATVHGSHLYGTAHAHSDLDIIVVATNTRTTHVISDDLDIVVYDLDTFVTTLTKGSPQSIELLYSPLLTFAESSPYEAFVRALVVNKYVAARSVKALAHRYRNDKNVTQYKAALHNGRLLHNMQCLLPMYVTSPQGYVDKEVHPYTSRYVQKRAY